MIMGLKTKQPSWNVLEERGWEKSVLLMKPSERKTKYLTQINNVRKANKQIREEGVTSAEIRPAGGQDFYYIRPARPFYEDNPVCKFAYEFDLQNQQKNRFQTVEGAKDAVLTAFLPVIKDINLGWGYERPLRTIRQCDADWHEMVGEEVRAGLLAAELREAGRVTI